MDVAAVVGWVREVHDTRACSSAGRGELTAGLAALRRLRSWVDAAEADLAAELSRVCSFPEADIAAAARTSVRDAGRVIERAGTLTDAPEFAAALDEAKVTAGHVDALGRALRQLEPAQRPQLLARVDQLVDVAEDATVEQFARRLRTETARIVADDGTSRLERQRRDTRLRTWVDQVTGMWHLSGRFDPATGLRLAGRLDNTVATLFNDSTPATCPTDPGEKQDHLRALALVALTEGRGSGGGRVEITAVIDTTTVDPATGGPLIDWGLPVELPASVLRDLYPNADVCGVIVRNGVVLHAPGLLDAGRTTRVANRAQRRALRALYKTCSIPECQVPYDHCKLHHVVWWRHGGRTDLANLLPVCDEHHHRIHDAEWHLTLGPNRELTIDLPDGTRYTTGPPQRGREQILKTTTRRGDPNRPRGPD